MDPNDPFAVSLSSLVLYQCHALAGQAEAALQEVDFALRNNPDSVSSRIFRASALQDLGMNAEAQLSSAAHRCA
jgi:Tfp pilus assembly protein PilF